MEHLDKIRFASLISDPEAYIEEMFQLHPEAKHDSDSGAIEIKNGIIDSSFRYQHLEEGFFLFSFSSFSPVDIEYEFIPNPKADYITLVFYFTENKTKHPLYLKIDEKFYSTDQISMFFNGKMNAEIFIKAQHKAFGIRLDIHKKWFANNINIDSLSNKKVVKEILELRTKGIMQTDSEQFLSWVRSIRKEIAKDKNPFQKLMLKNQSYQLLQNYIEETIAQKNEKSTQQYVDSRELELALNFLEKSLYEGFPGNIFLAELCQMSESSFTKKFKTAFKITAAQHFRNLKMKEALRLLHMGNNVKKVSYKIGYQDTSAFGRTFKQVYGKSPASYVK